MLDIFEALFDFGLLVLIWMVQLIIYPSFLYYQTSNLVNWHQKYTNLIALIVIPLMFGQLGFSVYNVLFNFEVFALLKLILILFIWIFTFAYFAPTHGKITKGTFTKELLINLVKLNWWRTTTWTLVFIISLVDLLMKNT